MWEENYIWLFEGSHEADVAPSENKFDTHALNHFFKSLQANS